MGFAILIELIAVGVFGRSQAEEDGAIRCNGHAQSIDVVMEWLPSRGSDDFLVGFVVAVGVDDEGEFRFVGNKNSLPRFVARGRERHADWRYQAAAVPELGYRFFQAVAIFVGEEINMAVV